MGMHVNHMEFAYPQMTITTPADLGIPDSPPEFKEGQQYEIASGDEFLILNQDKTACGAFIVQRWHDAQAGRRKQIELQNVKGNTALYLDTWQIGYLEHHGLIRPLSAASARGRKANLPGSALCLTDAQRKSALRWLEYLQAAQDECMEFNDGKPSRELMARAVVRVAKKRGETPPGMTSIYRKLQQSRSLMNFDPVLALAPKSSMGNNEPRLCDRSEEAIRIAVEDAWRDPKGTWKSVRARLERMTAEGGEYFDLANLVRDVDDQKRMLSRRTIQRRFSAVDKFTRDILRYGPEYAARVHARYIRQVRPERPLDVVDVDHTTLGIVVYDDERGIGYGRPDLVLFRDRHSGVIVGWAISFGPPSMETFLDGLLHALVPKSGGELPPGVSYPYHGRPVSLGVDNAQHLINLPIREAAIELGFQVTPYRPGRPWEKGALEHLFHILNIQLVDRLPGATTMSPSERKKFDEEKLKAVPSLSLSELNGFLAYYFAEVYHASSHEGLGDIHTFSGVPKDLWQAGIKAAPNRPLVDRDMMMVRIAGDTNMVTIQGDGVRWDYLVYQSADLAQLTLNPQHKEGAGPHRATQYKVTRDPSDLGHVWVHNPYNHQVIEVPIATSMASYAKGLKLYQHRKVVEHNREMKRKADSAEALMTSMRELEHQLLDIHKKRQKHGTAMKLARFISGQRQRIKRSEIVHLETPETPRLDYSSLTPEVFEPLAEKFLSKIMTEQASGDPEDHTPNGNKPDEADIDAIRSRHNEWE